MASTPEQIAAARKKARELALDDVDGPDLSVLAPEKLQEGDELGEPEGEGMAPEELSQSVRRPIAESMQTPLVEADAPEESLSSVLAGYDAAAKKDRAQARLRNLDSAGNFVSAELLGGKPMPSMVDEPSARKDFEDRGKLVRDWLSQKRSGNYKDAMARAAENNAQAALMNAQHPADVALDRKRKELENRLKEKKLNAKPGKKEPSEREKIQRERFERQKLQSEVPGFEEADPVHPHPLSPTDATELRKAATNRDVVLNGLKRLEDIRKANPHAVPSSEAMAEMKAIIAEMQGSIAGVNDFQLTQGHQELQHAMLDDPAAAVSYVNSGRLEKQIDALRHSVNASIASRAARMQRREVGLSGGGGGQSAETKVIGGKTYVKQGDRWVLK